MQWHARANVQLTPKTCVQEVVDQLLGQNSIVLHRDDTQDILDERQLVVRVIGGMAPLRAQTREALLAFLRSTKLLTAGAAAAADVAPARLLRFVRAVADQAMSTVQLVAAGSSSARNLQHIRIQLGQRRARQNTSLLQILLPNSGGDRGAHRSHQPTLLQAGS